MGPVSTGEQSSGFRQSSLIRHLAPGFAASQLRQTRIKASGGCPNGSVYGDQVAHVASASQQIDSSQRKFATTVVSQRQERTSDRSPISRGMRDSPSNPVSQDDENSFPSTAPAQRTSLTVSQLAALGASNNSTPVFQQNAAHTLRTELDADAVLIVDYTDAFGTKAVRAISGVDLALVGSEIWLPDWLTPADVDVPAIVIDTDPARLSAITAFASGIEYRSALAVAVPGTTGASGMIVALVERGVDFDDSQVEAARTVASLISLSASRSAALATVQRDEAQIIAARSIARTASNGPGDHSRRLEKIAGLLAQFFEFDIIVHRARVDGEFVTQGLLPGARDQSHTMSDPDFESVESHAAVLRTAVSNTTLEPEFPSRSNQYPAWKSAGIVSVLAIPVNGSATQVLILGSARNGAFKSEAVATANRLVPALMAAFANDNSDRFLTDGPGQARPYIPGYLESIASSTELMSACGVIATQVKNRSGASRVQVGFIDEETGRSKLEFDTESSEDILDFSWVNPDEVEQLTSVISGNSASVGGTADPIALYSGVRVPLKVTDRVIGFVEATRDDAGFKEADVAEIRRISSACAPVLANLRQLEQSNNTLKKLEMLNRVCDQIRLDDSGDPLRSPRLASLIRNLFDADWLYFGRVDHTNDHSTTEITDGLDVPELAPGVRVSRRSLLIPSTTAVTSPVTVDLDSVAPGQRASGRWMFRAGLRSAVCAPLRLNGIVAAMFMCASRKPTAFGSLEKKLAARIVTELETSIEKASTVVVSRDGNTGTAQIVLERLGPNLQAILNNTSVIVLTIDSKGIVTDVAGRGIEELKLVPERLLGRNFVAYSRKIDGLEDALKSALGGRTNRIEIEIFGIILDAWMEPIISPGGVTDAVTIVVSDITDRVSASRAELALQSLREDKERTSEFIAWLSHEMKSPLTTVVTLSDLLGMNERGNLHPDQLEDLNVIQQNADRLTLLVDDFLKISKMKAATFEIKPAKFRIAELARDIETSFAPVAKGRDQELSITAPDEQQFAVADRELLRQAIVNLLSNASKYSPVNTTVSLDIWIDSYDLRITVTDEGPGIPQEDRDRVFEPYRQLEKLDVPGTGMGLAIVRQIVELHKGTVWVEDSVGGGTSLAIWLPDSVVKP